MNGIFESVLDEILEAQDNNPSLISYLQPHASKVIRMLKNQPSSPSDPITLLASTTNNLPQICYTAEIIGWDDKRELTVKRRGEIEEHLSEAQAGEIDLFTGNEKAINLITIRNLRRLDTLHSTNILDKVSDGLPLKKRSRSGGSSEVYDIGELIDLPAETQQRLEEDLSDGIQKSRELTDAELDRKLASSSAVPQRIQIASVGYRRNAHVIDAVLRRANGVCERCDSAAPFNRRTDGSPFLEVHHWTPLSQNGEDTITNAGALCPNCHREVHYGTTEGEQTSAPNP